MFDVEKRFRTIIEAIADSSLFFRSVCGFGKASAGVREWTDVARNGR
jgi:hypothetical protein